jgi:hypothetical protein
MMRAAKKDEAGEGCQEMLDIPSMLLEWREVIGCHLAVGYWDGRCPTGDCRDI